MKDDFVYLRHIMECIRRIELNTGAVATSSSPPTPCRMPCYGICKR